MVHPTLTRPLSLALGLAWLAPFSTAATFGGNLLTNPSFEAGLAGWTVTNSSVTAVAYGSSGSPGTAVSSHISGGAQLLRDTGGNAAVEQTVSLASNPGGVNLRVGGYFGGTDDDDARLQVEFLNAGGSSLGITNFDYVTPYNRNFEQVLMLREGILNIPAGAVDIVCRVQFRDFCCGGRDGAADALFVEFTTDAVIPAPVALGAELILNPGFENGWSLGSPLSLNDTRGWQGTSSSPTNVKTYSDSDPTVPGSAVASIIEGEGNLLADLVSGGSLRQRLDLRGNAQLPSPFSGQVLSVSAFMGGAHDYFDDRSRVEVTFLDVGDVALSAHTLGPVTVDDRNGETTLLLREADLPIPPQTNYALVEVFIEDNCCSSGGSRGFLDNVSARLMTAPAPVPIPLGVNVVSNGCFEEGSMPGSPLEFTNSGGWAGLNSSNVIVRTYGSDSTVPPASFAATNGLGGMLLRDGAGDGGLVQTIDLAADEAAIDMGFFSIEATAWLGGRSSTNDTAELQLLFVNENDVPTGAVQVLGPVTAAMRSNQTTLLERTGNFAVPPQTRKLVLTLLFTNACCSSTGINGLADGIQVRFSNFMQSSGAYCFGTSTACPCGNSGDPGHGCANGTFASGSRLTAVGSSSIAQDELVLIAEQTVPYQPGLFFQGNNAINGGQGAPFGDGLRCAGGGLVRLQFRPADGCGVASTTVSIAQEAAVTAGAVKRYQWWYRDPFGSPCGASFNLSNAYEVQWTL